MWSPLGAHLRNFPADLLSAAGVPHPERMANRPTRSLKHEYGLFVEEEIENYKESIPRSALLGIGDEAVSVLAEQAQLVLTELLLAEEVDRLIFRRLRLPTYQTWRRRRLKVIREMRRPEHWGLQADDVVVRAEFLSGLRFRRRTHRPRQSGVRVADAGTFHRLTAVAGEYVHSASAAAAAGLGERVHVLRADWLAWAPDAELDAVIVTSAALRGLSAAERARVIKLLQGATADGGIHLVETPDARRAGPTLHELENRYRGWSVSLERDASSEMFLARKEMT